MRCFKVSC